MQNRWDEIAAAQCKTELELRSYSSRLLGEDSSLVLAGGGNTSVKLSTKNTFGETLEVLWVKGSGGSLKTITPAGFAPVNLQHLQKLSNLETLSDTQMMREFRLALLEPDAPFPSVETILHAILPHKWVDHTHADALVTIMNTPSGKARVREIYGNSVIVVPYVMPGFGLAQACKKAYQEQFSSDTIGMVLLNHGLFTWGETAKQSYDHMIELVSLAEDYLKQHHAWEIPTAKLEKPSSIRFQIAQLRFDISSVAKQPMIVSKLEQDYGFSQRKNLEDVAQRGVATVDHASWIKPKPMIGRDVQAFAEAYKNYFEKHSKSREIMLNPAPRVVLDLELGVLTVGKSVQDAQTSSAIYQHTIQMIERAERLERWQPLPEEKVFEFEYWALQQAKFKRSSSLPEFAGEVMLVTGAASGIGKACAEIFMARGAAVVGLDLNPAVTTVFNQPEFLGIECDVTLETALQDALEQTVQRFGGLDMLILNAGIFPASQKIASLDLETWQRTMRVNLDANLSLMREAHPLLKLAPNGGRVVVIASKNVPAPGPGAAAYSASKAALTQLARVAALEWGADGIRVNVLHPNAVFDTGIWTDEILEKRAKSYGLSVKEYKTNNVLKTEVSSFDVAELAASMCGSAFAKTTGAQVPIDGGNDRVI
jgi:rhamnose utilization protein RhaD (predicted bifunctional aldolase and dehydrogenase)/NAD(P)-dependent dehydrogenase (short-subunit alcohol dehydrogenase family)